jgi:hypothetical protein
MLSKDANFCCLLRLGGVAKRHLSCCYGGALDRMVAAVTRFPGAFAKSLA